LRIALSPILGLHLLVSMSEFRHKNIRLPEERYVGRQLYFVTLCFHNRRRLGSNPRIARWIIDQLRQHAAACEFFVHAYCVMPDHVHMLAGGASETSNLLKFAMSFKQETAAAFARKVHRPLWQFRYYDHILRGHDSADRVAWYIWSNPVRNGLSAKPTDYPFLGSFTEIGARMLKGSAPAEWIPPWKNAAPKQTPAGLKDPALR
jgi:putative transposase